MCMISSAFTPPRASIEADWLAIWCGRLVWVPNVHGWSRYKRLSEVSSAVPIMSKYPFHFSHVCTSQPTCKSQSWGGRSSTIWVPSLPSLYFASLVFYCRSHHCTNRSKFSTGTSHQYYHPGFHQGVRTQTPTDARFKQTWKEEGQCGSILAFSFHYAISQVTEWLYKLSTYITSHDFRRAALNPESSSEWLFRTDQTYNIVSVDLQTWHGNLESSTWFVYILVYWSARGRMWLWKLL